MKNMV